MVSNYKVRVTVGVQMAIGDDDVAMDELAEFEFEVNGVFSYAFSVTKLILPEISSASAKRGGKIGEFVFEWVRQNSLQKSQNSGQKVYYQVEFLPREVEVWEEIGAGEVVQCDFGDGKLFLEVVNDVGELILSSDKKDLKYFGLPEDVRLCRSV